MASLTSGLSFNGGAQSLQSMVRPLFEADGAWRPGSSEQNGDLHEKYSGSDDIDFDSMSRQFSEMEDPSEFRGDTINDIKWGLGKVGTVIKIVSAVLTLFGDGDTNVDRNDGLEDSIGTWMDVGATVLKVGLEKFAQSPATATSSVNKIGVAASTSQASPEVLAYVAKLTPDQIKLKQQQILNHVKQEVANQNLSPAEADALLSETLSFNGLPQISTSPLGGLTSLIGQGINKIGLPAAPAPASSPDTSITPGLPVPGTWEHTVTLALFNAQQYLNTMLKSKPSQPAIDNKIGVAAGASEAAEADGIIGAVASLPQSVTNAAVEVLKFVNPSAASSAAGGASGSQSYSEVVTGVDPTYAALGVLTTGALASVAYSYVASDKDIASSATSLALGAVDAIARNDLVENIKNNDIVDRISNNEIVQKISKSEIVQKISNSDIVQRAKHAMQNSKFIQKASTAIESIKRKIKGDHVPSDYEYNNPGTNDYYNIDYTYADAQSYPDTLGSYPDGFSPSWDDFQTNFDYLQEVDYSDRYPYQETQQVVQEAPQEVEEDRIEFYEPPPSQLPDEVSFITYTEDHNPWHLMTSGQSTDHLYRAFN